MTWNSVHLAGPPTVGVVMAEQMHDTLAVQLNAHPSGAWSLVDSRTDPGVPQVRVWKSTSSLNGLDVDFYVAFLWDEADPAYLEVRLAEEFSASVFGNMARTVVGVAEDTSLVFGGQWNLDTNVTTDTFVPIRIGDTEPPSGWFGFGVAKDGIHISNARTINDTQPQYVYVGAFDSFVNSAHLIDFEVPIMLRTNMYYGSMTPELAFMTRYPMVGANDVTSSATIGTWTKLLGGTLGYPASENPLAGVVASRQKLIHADSMTTGSVRGLAKHVLVTSNYETPYLNDRLFVNGREFAWAGPYWYDTTV